MHLASEVKCTALVYILVPAVQCVLIGAITSIFFVSFPPFFESCIFGASMHLHSQKSHTNLKSPDIFPMRFEGILILNVPIEFSHFAILSEIYGGQMPPQLRCMVE